MPIPPAPLAPEKARACSECGAAFAARRDDQQFCGQPCRRSWHLRRETRGTQLYDFAMAWRRKRRAGSLTTLCQTLDDWLREDRERVARRCSQAKG